MFFGRIGIAVWHSKVFLGRRRQFASNSSILIATLRTILPMRGMT